MTASSLLPLPLLGLLGLLGFTALAPAAALANPNGVYQRYIYESYGPAPAVSAPMAPAPGLLAPRPGSLPVTVVPHGGDVILPPGYGQPGAYGAYAAPQAQPTPARTCNAGTVLTGAVLGGGLSAALANGARNRRWALPMGAAVGGILGGVVSGC